MKKKCILVALFLGFNVIGWSQKSLNDYSYVIVPEQFEFLDTKDKYQLNSILNFLFNKHGFHSFLSNESPDAKRCDGLYADLERGKAFLRTKFSIILRDCDDNEIYRSPQGISKLKDFKKAYQDALRKAFIPIEELDIRQKDIEYFDDKAGSDEMENKEVIKVKKDVIASEAVEEAIIENNVDNALLPKSKFSNYSYNGASYLLRRTSNGYLLYEENTTTEDGLLLVATIELQNGSKILFIDAKGNVFKGSFDEMQNMLIQRSDGVDIYKQEN